jgi:cell division protein FtsB
MGHDAHSGNQSQSSDMASERLRKAIERNKAKQAKRSGQGMPSSPPPRPVRSASASRPARPTGQMSQEGGQESLMDRLKAARAAGQQASNMASPPDLPGGLNQRPRPRGAAQASPAARPTRPTSAAATRPTRTRRVEAVEEVEEENTRSWGLPGLRKKKKEAAVSKDLTTAPTRKTVAKPDNVEFTTSLRKSPRKSPGAVGYSTAKRKVKTKNKSKSLQDNAITYLVKGAWCFCLFLMLRLIFSEGGVVDYYASQNLMNDKLQEYQSIQLENKNLAIEINKIKKNKSYQKKLVRDNLGFIAKDEYLILFPKSKKMTSI